MKRPITVLSAIIGLCLLFVSFSQAQNFHVSSYTQDDGLTPSSVHGIVQDHLGFVWIASDSGLVRFDGERFNVVSQRRFLGAIKQKTGRIIVADEQGVWEVNPLPEEPELAEVEFSEALLGTEALQLYEDNSRNLWAVKGNKIIKESSGPAIVFQLPEVDQLWLSEDRKGVMWAFASEGSIYRFDKLLKTFELYDYRLPYEVSCAAALPDGGFLIGSKGVVAFNPNLEDPTKTKVELLVTINDQINFIVPTELGIFVGTQGHSLQKLIPTDTKGYQLYPVEDHTFPHSTGYLAFKNANTPFVGYDHSLWMSTETGICHLSPNLFGAVDVVPKGFIDAIDVKDNGDIYITQGSLFRIYKADGKMKGEEVLDNASAASSLAIHADRIWIGNSSGEVKYLAMSNHKESSSVTIRENKGLIFNIEPDPVDGSAWVCQAPNPETFVGIAKVSADLKVKYYAEEKGFYSRVLVTQLGKDGELYFGATGDQHYLYKYNRQLDRVESLSVPLPFKHNENFEVHDLHADIQGTIWLATTDGLLKYTEGSIERINLGEYTHDEIRAIDLQDDGTVWVTTDIHGLIKYTLQGYTSFSEHSGLTTDISNYRALLVDPEGMVWIGTAEGLELSQSANPSANPTLPPMLTGIRLPDERIAPHASHVYQIPSNTYLTIDFLTLAFSTEEMLYQTRITELGMAWSEPSKNQELSMPHLSPGTYNFEVRAKEQSGHKWSETSSYTFEVYTIWYMTYGAFAAYFLLLGLLVYVIVKLNTYRLKQQTLNLEAVIQQRTNELAHQKEEIAAQKEELATNNEQLMELNNEKNYYISVVAHDLKSPLNRIGALIDIIKMEGKELPETTQKYLHMVKQSVAEQKRLITDILDLQAIESHQANMHLEAVDLLSLAKDLSEDAKVSAHEKGIQVHLIHPEEESIYIHADPHYLRQIAENLLSNAIKFSPQGKNIYIEVRHQKNRVKYMVRDEGPGISPEDQQKMFRKFQKLSAKPTAGETSSGLGLSIVKRFAEAMDARVWCKSKLDEGATFIVEFDEIPHENKQDQTKVAEEVN